MIDEKILLKALRGFYEREQEYKLVADEKGIRYEPQTGLIDEIIKYVQKMPKVGEWIPCSERLPEDFETVTVTWVNREPMRYYEAIKDKPFVDTAMRFKGKWYWWSATLKDYLLEYGEWEIDSVDDAIEITAWQPLPEPWGGGKE